MLRLCVILNFSGLLWLENKKLPANDRELLFFLPVLSDLQIIQHP